jgi:hypothetical protein
VDRAHSTFAELLEQFVPLELGQVALQSACSITKNRVVCSVRIFVGTDFGYRAVVLLRLVLAALTTLGASTPTNDHVIRPNGEQQPLVLVVNSPGQQLAGLRLSEIIELADEAAAEVSDFDIVNLDVGSCLDPLRANELFLCLTEATLTSLGESTPYLMVLSIRPVPEGDRVVTSLVDLERAQRYLRDKDAESRIIDESIAVNVDPEIVASEEKLREYLHRVFADRFRIELTKSEHWRPYGTIEIRAEISNASIQLDEREVGNTMKGSTRLEGIRAGRRTVAITHPQFEKMVQVVDVRAGEIATLSPVLVPLPDRVVTYSRTAVVVLGAASSIAGVSLLAYAAAKPKRHANCIELEAGACEGSTEFARFGDSEGLFASPNGGGPSIAPLGYSLLGMGATWSLATLLFDSPDRMPWYELAAGVAVFGASLALSYALDGTNSVDALQ